MGTSTGPPETCREGARVGRRAWDQGFTCTLTLPQAGPTPVHTHLGGLDLFYSLAQPLPWGGAGRWACTE